MQCPECERLGMVSVFWWGSCNKESPSKRIYYDEFGHEHVHTHGTTQPHWCSNGHKFKYIWEEECSLNLHKWNSTYTHGESDTEVIPWCEDVASERLEPFKESEPLPEPLKTPWWLRFS